MLSRENQWSVYLTQKNESNFEKQETEYSNNNKSYDQISQDSFVTERFKVKMAQEPHKAFFLRFSVFDKKITELMHY